jgi:hypothetical protein
MIFGGQNGAGTGFHAVSLFSLEILLLPAGLYSLLIQFLVLYSLDKVSVVI